MKVEFEILDFKDIKGITFEETEELLLSKRKEFLNNRKAMQLEIHSEDLTKNQLMYMKKGIVPLSTLLMHLPERVIFIDEGNIKIIKDRYATVS